MHAELRFSPSGLRSPVDVGFRCRNGSEKASASHGDPEETLRVPIWPPPTRREEGRVRCGFDPPSEGRPDGLVRFRQACCGTHALGGAARVHEPLRASEGRGRIGKRGSWEVNEEGENLIQAAISKSQTWNRSPPL